MKALTWHGKADVRIENVPDPGIEEPGDILLQVTATAICGSDLHIYDGFVPEMKSGDILGHEFMGEVIETGPDVRRFKKGDRVVVPFVIACGHCFFCNKELWSLCDTTNPDAEKLYQAPRPRRGRAVRLFPSLRRIPRRTSRDGARSACGFRPDQDRFEPA